MLLSYVPCYIGLFCKCWITLTTRKVIKFSMLTPPWPKSSFVTKHFKTCGVGRIRRNCAFIILAITPDFVQIDLKAGRIQSQLVATLWLPQPWSPLTAQIVCAAPHEALARCKTVVDGSRNWMRMRKAFWEPFNIVLHLLIPREGTRGAAHTICAVNGDEGPGSHNSGCQMGLPGGC